MPRVSPDHLAARRRQIMDAARLRFTRNGFHTTSMQDLISEAGLSVGAFYRYFRSKEELIIAIVEEEMLGTFAHQLAEYAEREAVVPLPELIDWLVERLEERLGRDSSLQLAVQIWAEALRNPQLAEFVRDRYSEIRDLLTRVITRAQLAGELAPAVDPAGLGAALFSMATGYLLQRVLETGVTREAFRAGALALCTGTVAPPAGPPAPDTPPAGGDPPAVDTPPVAAARRWPRHARGRDAPPRRR